MIRSFIKNILAGPTRAAPAYPRQFALALAAYKSGDFSGAETGFVRLAATNPDDAEAWVYAGLCALERGAIADALPRLANARKIDPDNYHYQFAEARALALDGQAAPARRACMRVLDLAPDFNPAYMLWATLELPGADYFSFLQRLHAFQKPPTYIEIGVFRGQSLQFVGAQTRALGVDPAPQLQHALPPTARVLTMTSDEFFAVTDFDAELGGQPLALGFIDGMHRFEFALRDFINMERIAASTGTILIHDCYPLCRATALPESRAGFWSGDVWRLILILKKYRPDLQVHTLAFAPTGLGMVRSLDPASKVLSEQYDRIVNEFATLDYSVLDAGKAGMLNLYSNRWDDIVPLLRNEAARAEPAVG